MGVIARIAIVYTLSHISSQKRFLHPFRFTSPPITTIAQGLAELASIAQDLAASSVSLPRTSQPTHASPYRASSSKTMGCSPYVPPPPRRQASPPDTHPPPRRAWWWRRTVVTWGCGGPCLACKVSSPASSGQCRVCRGLPLR